MWGFLLWGFLALVALAVGLYRYLSGNGEYWPKLGVETLKTGELATFWERVTLKIGVIDYDLLVYNRFKHLKYAGLVEFRSPSLYVMDPDLLRQILVKDFDHFADRRVTKFNKHDLYFSKMLTNKQGKEWKDLRSIMSPTFTTGKIKRMFHFFNLSGNNFARYLREKAETDGGKVEFQDAFGRYTVDVISSVVFGMQTDVFKEDSYIRKMAKSSQTFGFRRLLNFFFLLMLPKIAKLIGATITDKLSMDFFAGIVGKTMEQRRSDQFMEKRDDFLQMVLEAQAGQAKSAEEKDDPLEAYEKDAELKDATPVGKKDLAVILDDDTLKAQTLLFFIAGFDTIESLLVFVAYELALNPEVQEKLAEEVGPAMDKHGGALSYEDLHSLEYLEMVISETLRHHPPAFATERMVTQEYRMPDSDLVLPKGLRLVIPINSIQHDERYYPEPDKFNPEHFSAENKAKRHPYAYLPFGQGPRNCIAMRFAIIEAKAAIAHLVYNFKVEPCDKTEIPLPIIKPSAIKKPAKGLWLQFKTREHPGKVENGTR